MRLWSATLGIQWLQQAFQRNLWQQCMCFAVLLTYVPLYHVPMRMSIRSKNIWKFRTFTQHSPCFSLWQTQHFCCVNVKNLMAISCIHHSFWRVGKEMWDSSCFYAVVLTNIEDVINRKNDIWLFYRTEKCNGTQTHIQTNIRTVIVQWQSHSLPSVSLSFFIS